MKSSSVFALRKQFPIFDQPKTIVYLDSAATTQKPKKVLDALMQVYTQYNGNVHRSAHDFAKQSTQNFEAAREKVATFIKAAKPEEIIFSSGCTSSLNIAAQALAQTHIQAGDEILIGASEHHANLVPWQEIAVRCKAKLKVVPVDGLSGSLDMVAFENLLSSKTKVVALTYISNVYGTTTPLVEIGKRLKKLPECIFIVDAAQAVAHIKVDVQEIQADLLAFSAHKMYGTNGMGVLYGRYELLEKLPPVSFGGEMIDTVTYQHSTYLLPPLRFEAGTPNYPAAIAMGEAIDFITEIGWSDIAAHQAEIWKHAREVLENIKDITIYGSSKAPASLISFAIAGVHHYDLEILLNKYGIAIRSGHHCAQPLMDVCKQEGLARISFGIYTSHEDIEAFATSLHKSLKMLGKQ